MSSSKHKISKSEDALIIKISWFGSKAFSQLGFTIVWSILLIVWVGIGFVTGAQGVMAFAFFVFPIVHFMWVVVSIYRTFCYFLNKTIVKIENNRFTVEHYPLPWKDEINIRTDKIEQFYIKQNKGRDKNNNVKYYNSLYLKTTADKTIKVLSHEILRNYKEAKNLEEIIEDFLKIEDYAVVGEYGAENKLTKEELKRDFDKKINPTEISLLDLKDEFVFNYDLSSWLVTFTIQYDWLSGNTDKLLQVISDAGDNKMLYVQKNMSIITPWIEIKTDNINFPSLNLTSESEMPDTLVYDSELYRLAQKAEGKLFHKNQQEGHRVAQSFYLNSEENKSVRIVHLSDNNHSIYLGDKKEERQFDDILHSADS
ncbi:hypothetical protein [Flammeovirga aprica]|uniref:Uncharacterized protein n=1 Tax=Flammeovirga aprica JL-4 TaxID=694437 RepID=A0A7X9RV27_9BACT|nr:hypothetical protein [Flammeovirga aprica]NME69174.1 hypothetical protein [Flammeovirga aprica JL-4]